MVETKFASSLSTHHLYAQTFQHVPPGGTAGQRLPAPGWRFSNAALR